MTTQRCSYIIKDEWEIDRWIWRGCRLRWQYDWGHLYTDARRHLPFLPCELSPRCILAATSSCTERSSAPDNSDGALRLAQIHLVCYTEDTKGLSREWSMMPPSRARSERDSASSPLLFMCPHALTISVAVDILEKNESCRVNRPGALCRWIAFTHGRALFMYAEHISKHHKSIVRHAVQTASST